MQCNSEKFQPGQIEFLTKNREGIKATLITQNILKKVKLLNPKRVQTLELYTTKHVLACHYFIAYNGQSAVVP